jgi:hypothetical protein
MKKTFSILFALVLALSLSMATVGLNCASPGAGPSLDAVAFGATGISVGSQEGTLTCGTPGSVTYLITVYGSGKKGKADLTVEGLPSGAAGSFNPSHIEVDDSAWPAYSTLAISTGGTTPGGTHTFTVVECPGEGGEHSATGTLTITCAPCVDADGDGYGDGPGCTGPDCDDSDPTTYPGATELCDGKDNDCDGEVPANENDSDGDGTPNCIDGCPNDPLKIAAGQCGCGVMDTDSDGDGTPNCIDGCPNDPLKIAAGQCGCGVMDTDSDGDGTPNCVDDCPFDLDKTEPGSCGCGVPDTDSDGDGQVDCEDLCPDDPDKTAPGACGCGVADTDFDGDSTPDCLDGCPNDPLKIAAGQCGCGMPDTDADNDGTVDCLDGCPNDSNKTQPGICGCGVPDTDSDGDGQVDCEDLCPDDPDKTAPGVCGCDVADTDTDGDGIPDCIDSTPSGAPPSVPRCETWYILERSSTEGGTVTRPFWGVPYLDYYRYAYCVGEVVVLEATPDAGYRFVNWTGDVDTIADVNAAFTTITMNGFYEIKANFELIK